jgi:site-specific DNA recombinase
MAGTPVVADIYQRISEARDGSVLGVERQGPPCHALLRQLGWTLGKVLTDNDRSAFLNSARPGFDELLDRQRRGLANAIIALDTDRLARQPRDNEDLIALAERYGTRIATVTGGEFDFTLLDEQLTFRLKGILAWRESQQKRLRMKLKHDELGRAGKFSGYRRPFGYDLVGVPIEATRPDGRVVTHLKHCQLVINEAEAREIRAAKSKLLSGGTLSSIMTDWNHRGVRRADSAGAWHTRDLRALLTNPRIAGLRLWHGELHKAPWKGIISREGWERVCLILENPKPDPRRGRRGPIPRTYLLTGGLGVCECEMPMRAHGKHGRRLYECDPNRSAKACGRTYRRAEPVEDFVRDAVLAAFGDGDRGRRLRRSLERAQGDDGDLRTLLAERKAWQARITRLEQEKIAGKYDANPDQFDRLNSGMQAGLAKVEYELSTRPIRSGLPVEIPESADAARAAWDSWTLDEQRAVVAFALKAVVFKPGFQSEPFHHSQVRLDWRV